MGAVPPNRLIVDETPVRNGEPVSYRTYAQMARLNDWTLGQGGVEINGYSPQVTLTAGTKYEFKYRTNPRYQALERRWNIRGITTSGVATVAIEAPSGGTSHSFRAVDRTDAVETWSFVEALSAQSAAETEITLAITATGADVKITSISSTARAA